MNRCRDYRDLKKCYPNDVRVRSFPEIENWSEILENSENKFLENSEFE